MAEFNAEYKKPAGSDDSDTDTSWLSPKSSIPPLQPSSAQVWRLDLGDIPTLAPTHLSPDELARAHRFRHAESRTHFIAARSALRVLLAHHIGTTPQSITLATTTHGKPTLPSHPELCFNLAHSGGTILIALALDTPIGVDLERITPNPDILEIAARMFTPAEQTTLTSLDPIAQRLAFFRLWSRKEAILKADGRGLLLSSTSFDTTSPTVLIDTTTYHLHDLPLAPTHSAALALAAPGIRPWLLRFPPVSLPSQ